ncbi:MAG: hypothetical protein HC880_21975 [Bacteroidia bacterium]|nr:hypothetical protein [Bacteroidia bacterium]
MKKPAFKIYKHEFRCDVCGSHTFMGIIGYTEKHFKICDLCLVNRNDEKANQPEEAGERSRSEDSGV